VADIGQCCPTSFTTGNLANVLKAEARRIGAEEVAKNYVYITAGSCGACRFGQYHQSYELALRNVGLDSFRMFLLGQEGLDQGPANGGGLDINMPFTLGAVWAIVLTDIVQDMEYQTRPYEKNPGETGGSRASASSTCMKCSASGRRAERSGARCCGTSAPTTS
jgi:predicted nucleotide-binding protein (sugar kinase/HSP70/actin superfamily)